MKIEFNRLIRFHSFGLGWGGGYFHICFWRWSLDFQKKERI